MSTIKAFTIGLVALAAVAWAPSARAENHRQYADTKPEDCAECHRSSGVMENHGAFFLKEHRQAARKTPNNCSDCHLQSWCADCHHGGNGEHVATRSLSRRGEAMPESHGADITSTHAIKATDDPQSCGRCHDAPKFCSDCHAKQTRVTMRIKPHKPTYTGGVPDASWVTTHRAEARRNLQSCQACHPQKQDCSSFACHPSLGGR